MEEIPDDSRILRVCRKMDSLFMEEGLQTAYAFNCISTWIVATTLNAVTYCPDMRPEDDVLKLLEETGRLITSQAEEARKIGRGKSTRYNPN